MDEISKILNRIRESEPLNDESAILGAVGDFQTGCGGDDDGDDDDGGPGGPGPGPGDDDDWWC